MKKILRILIPSLCLFLPVSIHAQTGTAEPGFHPYISIQEEYNDNIYLTNKDKDKKDDYITTARPGLKYTNMDAKSGINFDYNLGFVYYGKETDNKYISHNGSLDAKYLTSAHFNFYLKDTFIRSDEHREYEYFTTTEENKYMLSTRLERKIYWRNVVAPTIEYQFGKEDRIGINYRNNIYREKSTANAVNNDSQEDYINPFFDIWLNQQNGIHLEYGYTIGNFEDSSDMTAHMANARYTYRFTPKSSVFMGYMFTRRTFDNTANDNNDYDYDIHEPFLGISYAFSPTFSASAQVGYFWKEMDTGSKTDGVSYKASITNRDVRTTLVLSLQGGYTEDYFTSENLGFNRYHRLTGSVTHFLEKRTSIGLTGNIERVEYSAEDRDDWIWGVVGSLSHTPLKWLTIALEISHKELNSNIETNDYEENRGMIKITATY